MWTNQQDTLRITFCHRKEWQFSLQKYSTRHQYWHTTSNTSDKNTATDWQKVLDVRNVGLKKNFPNTRPQFVLTRGQFTDSTIPTNQLTRFVNFTNYQTLLHLDIVRIESSALRRDLRCRFPWILCNAPDSLKNLGQVLFGQADRRTNCPKGGWEETNTSKTSETNYF